MYLKVHRTPDGGQVVAVCDRELLNTTIRHGDLEVEIREAFYGSMLAEEQDVAKALAGAENANLMGERAVSLAVRMGLISRSSCIMVGAVPHAQIITL